LVVDTCPRIDEAELLRMRNDLIGMGCANGILFDEERCVILRDTFESGSPDSIVLAAALATAEVLERLGAFASKSLDHRVGRWLELLSEHWDGALPAEPAAAAPFLPDIVPAAGGAVVRLVA